MPPISSILVACPHSAFPMASTSSIRQAAQASQRTMSRRASRPHSGRRPMGTSSAMTIPPEDTPVIDLRIFDIFDAPSRLGESSKLLSRAASSSSTCRPERPTPTPTATISRPVSSLPSPIVFDGPARPLSFDYGMHHTSRRTHSYAPLSPRSNHREHTTVTPLPNPIMFDGPSRLRPYIRGRSSLSDESSSSLKIMLAVAASGAVALAGFNALNEKNPLLKDNGRFERQ